MFILEDNNRFFGILQKRWFLEVPNILSGFSPNTFYMTIKDEFIVNSDYLKHLFFPKFKAFAFELLSFRLYRIVSYCIVIYKFIVFLDFITYRFYQFYLESYWHFLSNNFFFLLSFSSLFFLWSSSLITFMLLELESLEKFYWWFCGDQVQNEVVFLFFYSKGSIFLI